MNELSARAERLPAFIAAPHGDSTYTHTQGFDTLK
jgi:hypothetical protein